MWPLWDRLFSTWKIELQNVPHSVVGNQVRLYVCHRKNTNREVLRDDPSSSLQEGKLLTLIRLSHLWLHLYSPLLPQKPSMMQTKPKRIGPKTQEWDRKNLAEKLLSKGSGEVGVEHRTRVENVGGSTSWGSKLKAVVDISTCALWEAGLRTFSHFISSCFILYCWILKLAFDLIKKPRF